MDAYWCQKLPLETCSSVCLFDLHGEWQLCYCRMLWICQSHRALHSLSKSGNWLALGQNAPPFHHVHSASNERPQLLQHAECKTKYRRAIKWDKNK